MKILYIDPVFGISGDMMISAFIDAGMPMAELETLWRRVPHSLPSVTPERRKQGIIEGTHLKIGKSDLHLSVSEMEAIIDSLEEPQSFKENAQSALQIIVGAEAKVHGTTKEEVHLHELSHIDTLIDITGVAKGMDYFGIEKVFAGPVPVGNGTIRTAHGVIPNPAPATVEILRGYPVTFVNIALELTTPTGATIIRHYVKNPAETAPPFSIGKIGHGVGTYVSERPDVLRIFIGETEEPLYDEEIWLIEADIDDMNMEYTGAVAERVREEGALDVLFFPVHMKKGRVGIRLSVSARASEVERLVNALFRETTTFGLRLRKEMRRTLRRDVRTVETSCGPVTVKTGYDRNGKALKSHVEFDDVKRIAAEKGIPILTLLDMLKREAG
jgi:uncharacterized protein (TIGR00299 family) protein